MSEHLTRAQRAADVVTEFCGSWTFIISFSVITLGWMGFNTIKVLTAFDPYPYILLNLFLTVISTFQSPLIMMSQNRQMERDRDAVQGLHAKLDEMKEAAPEILARITYGSSVKFGNQDQPCRITKVEFGADGWPRVLHLDPYPPGTANGADAAEPSILEGT